MASKTVPVTPPEPRWVDLPPAERARRLAQPITIASHGGNKSWGGCNLQDHLQDQEVAPRDQWF